MAEKTISITRCVLSYQIYKSILVIKPDFEAITLRNCQIYEYFGQGEFDYSYFLLFL